MDARPYLQTGIEQLNLKLPDNQLDNILAYIELIQTWNKAYNLVGTSDTKELVQKHILDSLAIIPYVTKTTVLDVGSGAGLPGIPLAIVLPDISFTLLDSNGKKARFMRQVVMQLKLTNVNIEQNRIEQYSAEALPYMVLSRAFAPLDKALELLKEACSPQGLVLIMLGVYPEAMPKVDGLSNIEFKPISVPGLNSQRHLLIAHRD